MFKLLSTAFVLLFFSQLFAQSNSGLSAVDNGYNLDFERMISGETMPDLWSQFNVAKGYKCEAVTDVQHRGNQSLLIERVSENADPFGSVTNVIPAKYLGKEIEFKAWIKFQDVKDFMGLLIRIDDANRQTIAFRSMANEKINGTKNWTQYSVKLRIPPDAQTIYIASILGGPGKMWTDDAQVLIDGKDISEAKTNPDYNPHPPQYGNNTFAGHKVRIKDAELYYETYGTGEPLLLLHGNSQSIRAFSYQIGALSKKYKVIAIDTRGQGKSTDETTGALSYDLFADDMKQFMDSLRMKKASVLGWSDGGNTGLIMAYKYPGYISKLVTMGANLFPTTEAISDTVINQVKSGLKNLQTKTDDDSKMEVRLFTMLLTEPHITFDEIKTIKCPVLVMAGEHDDILDSHTHAIATAIPGAKLMILKDATHYAPVEDSFAFNQAVLQFLDRP
ncbi:MAG: alpha/beta hydrolase [Bacteroidota bacterium]